MQPLSRSVSPSPSRLTISSFQNHAQPLGLGDHSSIHLGSSNKPLAPTGAAQRYQFRFYFARAIANTLGPLAVVAVYLFIVFEYLEREEQNGVIPNRVVSANALFVSLFYSCRHCQGASIATQHTSP